MKSRLAASVVLSALVLAGATGCTFITPQASTIAYSASDGVNVSDDDAPLAVRNAFVVADESGQFGNLIAGIVNPTDDDLVLLVTVTGLDPIEIEVPAGETVSLGANADPVLLQGVPDEDSGLEGVDFAPGSTVEVHFQSGDSNGVTANVPVLDGALPYYTDLVPEPVPMTAPGEIPVTDETSTPVPTDAPEDDGSH
ncbi:DNA modification methylase [Microbacterium tumbae]